MVDRRAEPHQRIGVAELIAGTVEARIVDLDIAPEKRPQTYAEVEALRHEHSVACLFDDESVVDTQPQRPAKPYAFHRDVIAGSLRRLSDSNILDKILNKRYVERYRDKQQERHHRSHDNTKPLGNFQNNSHCRQLKR